MDLAPTCRPKDSESTEANRSHEYRIAEHILGIGISEPPMKDVHDAGDHRVNDTEAKSVMGGGTVALQCADVITDSMFDLPEGDRLDLGRQLLDLIPPDGGNFLRTYAARLAKHDDDRLAGDHHARWLARRLGTAVVTGEATRLRDSLGHDVEPWGTFNEALKRLLDHEADVIAWTTADPRLVA
jgi:hypothetical protein